jgi:hypothetical protein
MKKIEMRKNDYLQRSEKIKIITGSKSNISKTLGKKMKNWKSST